MTENNIFDVAVIGSGAAGQMSRRRVSLFCALARRMFSWSSPGNYLADRSCVLRKREMFR